MPRPPRLLLTALLAAGLLMLSTVGRTQPQALPAPIAAALAQAQIPAQNVSLLVLPVDANGAARLSHRADAPMNPASVMKLLTTYAALDTLGPNFSWATPVYLDGPVRDGVLHGNLYIQGRGDPKLVLERLWLLLRRVQGLGIERIRGDIVLDHSAFEPVAADPGEFDGERLRPYNAAPDALLLNFKAVVMTFTPDAAQQRARVSFAPSLAGVQLQSSVPLSDAPCEDYRGALQADLSDPARIRFTGRYPLRCGEKVWPLAYADPPSYAGRTVQALWREVGGQLDGRVRDGVVPSGLSPVFELSSPPLAEVIRDINKYSNNVMAQQLFLTLSLQDSGSGTLEGSRALLTRWWTQRFGTADVPQLDNGSGLSRSQRISARALGQLLQAAWASPLMPELASSLPISGVDGTLQRFKNGSSGSAHLKTGSLRDVSARAGYVDGRSGRRYVLVMLVNHPNAHAARAAFDAAIEWTQHDR